MTRKSKQTLKPKQANDGVILNLGKIAELKMSCATCRHVFILRTPICGLQTLSQIMGFYDIVEIHSALCFAGEVNDRVEKFLKGESYVNT
jgi:hypothetical protein